MKTLSKAMNNAVFAENLEDIIFENRNHEYGAYSLRRNYNSRMNLSLFLVISAATLIILFLFIRSAMKPDITVVPEKPEPRIVKISMDEIILPPPVVDLNVLNVLINRSLSVDPVIVDKDVEIGDLLLSDDLTDLLNNDGTGGDLSNIDYIFTDDPGGIPTGVTDSIYNVTQVHEQAMFRGGTVEDFRIWLIKNMQYPDHAEEIDLFGTVFVKFTIGKDDKLKDVAIQRSVHPLLDRAAVEAIETSRDDWRSARINGYPVNVSYTIPIKFNLQK